MTFFSYENQVFPPSLSDFSKICFGQKSLLLGLDSSNKPDPPEFFQCKIHDGAAVMHFLPTVAVKTFAEYADKIFILFLLQQLQQAHRIDCVWDRYIANSIKEVTREHRGHGIRTKVSGQTRCLINGYKFQRTNRSYLLFLSTNLKCLALFLKGRISIEVNG